jgi:hypothetical protein
VYGDVGANPVNVAATITEVEPIIFMNGGKKVYEATVFGAAAVAAHAAAIALKSEAGFLPADIAGKTFKPGHYYAAAAVGFSAGTCILDGDNQENPVFHFHAGSTSFTMINGAKAENVLWAVGTSATLGAGSIVEGSISAGAAITVGTGAVLHGCALAGTAITFATSGFIEPQSSDLEFLASETEDDDVSIVSKPAGTSRPVHCAHSAFRPLALQFTRRSRTRCVKTSLSTLETP